jgi:hypothetical protein
MIEADEAPLAYWEKYGLLSTLAVLAVVVFLFTVISLLAYYSSRLAKLNLPDLIAVYFCSVKKTLAGMSGQIARQAILLATLPAGFLGMVFGVKYGVWSRAIDPTLTLSYLASVITFTAAILLTSQMK